jgi:hypothetical protein
MRNAVVVFVVVVLSGIAASSAAAIEPGFDLFETDPEGTVFSFREEFAIPPNFFDQGSAPFQGDVSFGGVPLNRFEGRDVGNADTVVRRNQAVTPPGSSQTELVQLSLASMQPIQVTVGEQAQLWDVNMKVSPSRQSGGQIQIAQTSELGGTYGTSLVLVPLFTFTRLSDGATRTLDIGAGPPGGERFLKLRLTSQNVPWRTECRPPALVDLAFHPDFCPGLTPEGVLVEDNVQEAPLVRHKTLVAQPRLEHFRCYRTSSEEPRESAIRLTDQFGSLRVKLRLRGALCAPAQKNREPLPRNRAAHLQCYTFTAKRVSRSVIVRNQFGSTRLRTVAAKELCAPATKTPTSRSPRPLPRENEIDHFTCYSVRTVRLPRVIGTNTRDQFGRRRIGLRQIDKLCLPTTKNGELREHPVDHLVCYSGNDRGSFRARTMRTRDQFGTRDVDVSSAGGFCVPSSKQRVG